MALRSFLIIIFLISIFVIGCNAQSRTNRLYRTCPASTARAVIEVQRNGDINIVPCTGRSVLLNGTTTTGLLSSLNGLTATAQVFAVPTANDTAAWSSATATHTLQLPITAVSGSSRTNFFPYFSAANTFAKSPFSWDGTSFNWNNAAFGSQFPMLLTPSATNAVFSVGDTGATSTNYFSLSTATNAAIISSSTVNLGNASISGFGTLISVTDSDRTFSFFTGNLRGVLNLSGIANVLFQRSFTGSGTTGNRTINVPAGTVNFAAGTSAITVTNSTVTIESIILLGKRTNDATCDVDNYVAAAGSFVINMTANCTAETSVGFLVTN